MKRIAWNKGLSKETDSRVAKYARKRPPRTDEHKRKLGEANKGKKMPASFHEKMKDQWVKPNSGQFSKGHTPDNSGKRSGKYWISKWHPEYEIALLKKTGCCEICGINEIHLSKKLAFDHDHYTGKFRGWLCGNCNLAIGYVDDNVDILKEMINYLEKHA